MTRRRLDSWKEIAAYVVRDVTTVRRWEKREGLPVHRHVHDKLGTVYAFTDEIDAWVERRRDVTSAPTADPSTTSEPRPRVGRWWVPAVVLAIAILTAALAMPRLQSAGAPEPPRPEVAIVPPDGVTVISLALSPAGDEVAFTGSRAGEPPRLWIRRLNSIAATELAGTEDASFLFWSFDGRHVGFFAQEKLKTIALGTSEIRSLADAPDGRGGSWSEHDVILFAPDDEAPIFRVSAQGGDLRPATTLDRKSVAHVWPEFLPGGRRFVYHDQRPGGHGIYLADLETADTRRLVKAYSSAGVSRDGYLFFVTDHLMAQKLDLETGELAGDPVAVADGVLTHFGWLHKADFSLARNGMLALRRGLDAANRLAWVDRAGREHGSLTDAVTYSNPAIAPDGRQAIVTAYGPGATPAGNLWRIDLATLQASRMTFSERLDVAPLWSPAGDRLMFLSNRRGRMELFERPATTTGDDVPFPPLAYPDPAADTGRLPWRVPESWTRDGRYLTYSVATAGTKSDVWIMNLDAPAPPLPLLAGPYNETQSQMSPDGRSIAYASDETGRFEVYIQDFPVPGRKHQVSSAGGADPRWRGDGRELYFIGRDRSMMAVEVRPGDAPRYGPPRRMFQTQVKYLWQDTRNHYDVTPDGQRFLILAPPPSPQAPFTLLYDWRPAPSARRGIASLFQW